MQYKDAEQEFEDYWKKQGKFAWCYRLADKAEVFGRNLGRGRGGNVRAQPCDYIVVDRGATSFCEVKSSQDPTAFRFSMLRKNQSAMAAQIIAAGGDYWIYVKSQVFDRWHRIDYRTVKAVKNSGQASIPWKQLEAFKCSM